MLFNISFNFEIRKSRNRRSKQHHINTKTLNTIAGEHGQNVSNVNDGYQELGEIGKNDTTYDVPQ